MNPRDCKFKLPCCQRKRFTPSFICWNCHTKTNVDSVERLNIRKPPISHGYSQSKEGSAMSLKYGHEPGNGTPGNTTGRPPQGLFVSLFSRPHRLALRVRRVVSVADVIDWLFEDDRRCLTLVSTQIVARLTRQLGAHMRRRDWIRSSSFAANTD